MCITPSGLILFGGGVLNSGKLPFLSFSFLRFIDHFDHVLYGNLVKFVDFVLKMDDSKQK